MMSPPYRRHQCHYGIIILLQHYFIWQSFVFIHSKPRNILPLVKKLTEKAIQYIYFNANQYIQ